jgi:hypothetical protein
VGWKGGGSWAALGKTIFECVFKGKIIFKKSPQDLLYQKSSDLEVSCSNAEMSFI